jgi:glucose/arabinose dehydrogenase
MMQFHLINPAYLILFIFLFVSCRESRESKTIAHSEKPNLHTNHLKVPKGFKVDVFAKDVQDARSLAIGESGAIFVGNRVGDKVYALIDKNQDYFPDNKVVVAEGLRMPNGLAVQGNDLYVVTNKRILKFPDIEKNPEGAAFEEVYTNLPPKGFHGWRYAAFGPDKLLYVSIGSPCDECEKDDLRHTIRQLFSRDKFATISRFNTENGKMDIYAEGVRNTLGFDWHPETKQLWFTENGRDYLGDSIPPDEINIASGPGLHFGFPYCHGGNLIDPEYQDENIDCSEFEPPIFRIKAHSAALGMKFYQGSMFPEDYQGQLLVAEHGSWNRSQKVGYRIMKATVTDGKVTDYQEFISGWLDEATQEHWGRPVDLLVLPDGSLLISDDFAHVIYRVSYQPEMEKPITQNEVTANVF